MESHPPPQSGRDDVEKSWHDPKLFHTAIVYVAGVIGLAAIAAVVFLVTDRGSYLLASTVPAVCLLGGIGALIMGYRTYRRGGTWVIWQGTAWVLLAFMLVAFAFPMMVDPSLT